MTERPIRSPVDLHGFALREFLEFVRKQDPAWIEGAQVRRSDDGHQRSGVVEGKVWVEVLWPASTILAAGQGNCRQPVLISDKTAEALARVLARVDAFDANEADAVLSLRKALRLGDVAGA